MIITLKSIRNTAKSERGEKTFSIEEIQFELELTELLDLPLDEIMQGVIASQEAKESIKKEHKIKVTREEMIQFIHEETNQDIEDIEKLSNCDIHKQFEILKKIPKEVSNIVKSFFSSLNNAIDEKEKASSDKKETNGETMTIVSREEMIKHVAEKANMAIESFDMFSEEQITDVYNALINEPEDTEAAIKHLTEKINEIV